MPIECAVAVGNLSVDGFRDLDYGVMRHAFDAHNQLGGWPMNPSTNAICWIAWSPLALQQYVKCLFNYRIEISPRLCFSIY